MPKYDIWIEITEDYQITIEADSFADAWKVIYNDPLNHENYESRSWIDHEVILVDWSSHE